MLKINGFTLVELAIGMLIMSFLIGFVILPLSMQRESADIKATQTVLEQIKEAIIGYVLVNRHLPCPATDNSNGQESPIASGNCTRQHGFVPARTLNILGATDSKGLLLDTWGNPYRYSVSSIDRSVTTNNLKVCEDGLCTKIVAEKVPVIIFSMGKNGSQSPSTLEAENLGVTVNGYLLSSDNNFVQTTYNNSNSANHFDDVIAWVSPYVLYNRMVQAGVYPP